MNYRNCISLGTKIVEDELSVLYNQRVRIDSVILPKWAKNAHHYIQQNYLTLEDSYTKTLINKWIDLVFGKNQQSAECFNLFKPLTSEVI